MLTLIKSYLDGDEAIYKRYIPIYEWHLNNREISLCEFTPKSLDYAVQFNDAKLVKQLLDIGIKYNYHNNSNVFRCLNRDILDLLLPRYKEQYTADNIRAMYQSYNDYAIHKYSISE
jgi:hypothetical protein